MNAVPSATRASDLRTRNDPVSVWPLIIAAIPNLLTLVLYLAQYVSYPELVWCFLSHSLIFGIFRVLRYYTLEQAVHFKKSRPNGTATASRKQIRSYAHWFTGFVVVFHAAYGGILCLLTFVKPPNQAWQVDADLMKWVALDATVYFLCELVRAANERRRDSARPPQLEWLGTEPVHRVFVIHMGLLLAGFQSHFLAGVLLVLIAGFTEIVCAALGSTPRLLRSYYRWTQEE